MIRNLNYEIFLLRQFEEQTQLFLSQTLQPHLKMCCCQIVVIDIAANADIVIVYFLVDPSSNSLLATLIDWQRLRPFSWPT